MTGLPGYLRGIGRVVADQMVASSLLALRVRERLPHLLWKILPRCFDICAIRHNIRG